MSIARTRGYVTETGMMTDNIRSDRPGRSTVPGLLLYRQATPCCIQGTAGTGKKTSGQYQGFQCKGAFFDCTSPVDLSFAEFSGADVNFEGAFFDKNSIINHAGHAV